jgi:hypothetical protein
MSPMILPENGVGIKDIKSMAETITYPGDQASVDALQSVVERRIEHCNDKGTSSKSSDTFHSAACELLVVSGGIEVAKAIAMHT